MQLPPDKNRVTQRWMEAPLVAAALLLVAVLFGCEQAPPTPADLTKSPWLDPVAQLEGLKSQDVRIRGASAFNLGNIGAAAEDAIPALEKLAKDDPVGKVRENASKALEKIKAAID